MKQLTRSAFTLVELSIVLVILGLLVGGVLTGQALIRAAELRSVGTEYTRYITATHAFRDKYFALPGDMTNATSFWGSAGGTGSNNACQVATHTGTATCNGNGDGIVTWNSSAVAESAHYWQHLANAGLIEGTYNGSMTITPGVSTPKSKLDPAYFYPGAGGGYYAGSTSSFAADYGKNMYSFWGNNYDFTTSGSGSLKPEDAWNIDTKLDDGKPGSGIIIANKGNNTTMFCTSGDNVAPPADANASYSLTKTAKDCAIQFVKVF